MPVLDCGSANDRPKTVLVLGMHRSGTSLLAQVLDRAGIKMGDNLMPADEHNPDGYFEDLEIVTVHDRILVALDRAWGSVRSTLPLPDDWQQHPEVIVARADLRAIVERRLRTCTAVWGFKDPRTCRLLPLWLQLLAEACSSPVLLLSNRAPAEVACSLEKRDGLPPRLGELLWLVHMLDVLHVAGDRVAVVVDWDRWLAAPQSQVASIAAAVGLPEEALASVVQATLKPTLRRQRLTMPATVPFAAEVHALLVEWSRKGVVSQAAVASVCTRFYQAQAVMVGWADVALAQDWTAELHRRNAEISRVKGDCVAAQAALATYRTAYDRDLACYSEALIALGEAEVRLGTLLQVESKLTLALRQLEAERAQARDDLVAAQDVLAEVLATPGFAAVRVSVPNSVAEAVLHIRNAVFSARWGICWPLRRIKG
jgi:hypothetical protein